MAIRDGYDTVAVTYSIVVINRLVRAQQMTSEQAEMLRALLVAAEAK